MAAILNGVRKQPILPVVSVMSSRWWLYDYWLWSFDLLAPSPFSVPLKRDYYYYYYYYYYPTWKIGL